MELEATQGDNVKYYFINSEEKLYLALSILDQIKRIALDTEVYALKKEYGHKASVFDPHTSRIRLIQINFLGNKVPFLIDINTLNKNAITKLKDYLAREDIEKVIFNSKFDLKAIRSTFGMWIPNTKCAYVNMLKLGLCNGYKSALMRGNSYKAMCRDYLNIELNKEQASSNWASPSLSNEQLTYAALDVGAPEDSIYDSMLLRGYDVIKETLIEIFQVGLSLEIDQEVVPLLAKSEYTGLPVCKDLLSKFLGSAELELEELKLKLCKDLGFSINKVMSIVRGKPKFIIVIPEDKIKLLNSPTKLVSVVNKVLKSKGIEIDNFQSKTLEKVLKTIQQTTEEEIIEEDKDDFWIEEYKFDVDLINNLIQYKKLSKLLSTDYEDIINPVTLNLHSHFNPNGTSTGRMSSSGSKRGGFNAQQITTKTFDIGDYSQEQFFNSQSKILI